MIDRLRIPTIGGYLLREVAWMFLLCLVTFVALYLLVDFFERLPKFLEYAPPASLIIRYFLFKVPLIVTQVTPVAVLAAVLLAVGSLARGNEILAMRACGVSLWQIAAPVVGAALVLSLGIAAWNELVVPPASFRARTIQSIEIKKRSFAGHFSEAAIWYHADAGFTNIERFDSRRNQILGFRRFELDPGFQLHRIVEAEMLEWNGAAWHATGARESVFSGGQLESTRQLNASEVGLVETPEDFTAVHHDPDDLNSRALNREIDDLRRKGIDTTEDTVDLWLKSAIPFTGLVLALVALPLASRSGRNTSVGASASSALAIGFLYWVILAITTSLGKGGVLPAVVAAWAPNLLFSAIGLILFLSVE